jgi:hypothetical protein
MPIPLYGFLEGDTIGLLIPAEQNETIDSLAEKLQEAASLRVAPRKNVSLVYAKNSLEPTMTVAQSGMKPLERFDVVRSVH